MKRYRNESPEIKVIRYSDKSIAVIGETTPIRHHLYALGGKFNMFLKCGPGWVFPKSQMDTICETINNL